MQLGLQLTIRNKIEWRRSWLNRKKEEATQKLRRDGMARVAFHPRSSNETSPLDTLDLSSPFQNSRGDPSREFQILEMFSVLNVKNRTRRSKRRASVLYTFFRPFCKSVTSIGRAILNPYLLGRRWIIFPILPWILPYYFSSPSFLLLFQIADLIEDRKEIHFRESSSSSLKRKKKKKISAAYRDISSKRNSRRSRGGRGGGGGKESFETFTSSSFQIVQNTMTISDEASYHDDFTEREIKIKKNRDSIRDEYIYIYIHYTCHVVLEIIELIRA